MGFDNEHAGTPMVLDIETVARDGIEQFLDAPTAPSNYKDQAKIAEAKAEKLRTQLANAALDIHLNRIVAIGVWSESTGINVVVAKTPAEERTQLASLGVLISNGGHHRTIITFNGLSFDLPNVIRRAELIGLHHFPALQITPSWRSPHTDLMEILTAGGKVARHSLDFYCRVRGITADVPEEVAAIKGADIGRLVAEGRWDLVEGHCRADVQLTTKLAQRLGVLP